MADTYTYRVRDHAGALVSGQIVADNRALVLTRLRELGYVPIEVKQKGAGLGREIRLRPGRVKLKDLAVFTRQFATMVNSGLPMLRTLATLEEQTSAKELARVVGEIRLDVEGGTQLSASMAKHPRAFSKLYVAMTRAGETSGTLDQVMVRLAETIEKEVSLRHKIKSAMTYPVVVFGLVVVILAAMLLFVVPTFEDLYSALGGRLPLPTRMLIAVSATLRNFLPFIVAGVVVLVLLLRRWTRTERGRHAWDRFKLKIPIFGKLVHKSALSRFSRTMSVLSRSGVPILESLDIVADTVNNALIADAVRDLQASVKRGESISGPLRRHNKMFPAMVVQMMAVGEETGALDSMLEKIAQFYDEEVTAAVESLTSMIEPLLIAVVGGAVGLIVICLYLPLFRIVELIE